ncbi:WxL domain-containing protein [Kurthia sibirica]|uniref:WxL domain-containing protein n=1 Tax=Kurthia sibirica TaxID=202750 RepID=A0A2U3AP00_9BACL|nr:WxL domain-containing protein [Kurthia sibirica]PWI26175.1 WxL domain-containing protein [Kurthia sibirica]GEK33435.1 hypothetical protein KSI01_09680 [Kurthia sibirica]
MNKFKLGMSAVAVLALVASPVIGTSKASAVDGANYESNGKVSFVPNTSTTPVDPVDPTDPTKPVVPVDPTDPTGPNPGTAGPLSIDFASSIDFGSNEISNQDEVYYANAQAIKDSDEVRANYAQVTDRRGSNKGWSLSVKQNGQFKNDEENTVHNTLDGAVIKFAKGTTNTAVANATHPTTYAVTLDPSGEANSVIVDAAQRTGAGTWTNSFGALESKTIDGEEIMKNTGISLEIPGNTPKDAVDYKTKLTWVLSDTPSNL